MADQPKPQDMYRTQTLRDWPPTVHVTIDKPEDFDKETDLKYATNPFHAAAVYNPRGNTPLFTLEKSGKGGPSQTNYEDVDRALRIIRVLAAQNAAPAVAVMKHVNPTGVAVHDSVLEAFVQAWDCDVRAAYGGTVAFNRPVTMSELERAYKHIRSRDSKTFIDVMVAPGFSPDALEYMGKKESIRLFRYDAEHLKQLDPFVKGPPEIKRLMDGRILVFEPYVEAVRSPKDLKAVTKRKPSDAECRDMLMSWYVSAHTRSNAIVFGKSLATVAVGTGRQERIGAIEDATLKAEAKAEYRNESADLCLENAVMASDGFIPNIDNIIALRKKGVTAIVQPGGSMRDEEIIKACDEAGIAMAFTNWRCFSHH